MSLNSLPLKAAIVDLDGTMVNTLGDFEVALNRVLSDLGIAPASRALIERSVGKGSEHLIRCVMAHQTGLAGGAASPQAVPEDLVQQALVLYEDPDIAINGQHSSVYPGVIEGLQQLVAAGLQLACVTNKPMAFTGPLLAQKGLSTYFACVFGGDSFERKKPHPMPLQKTCEAMGVSPAETLMVGDSSNDAQAARAAGCPVVLMTYGYNHGEPIRETPALAWLDSLADLAPLLRQA